MQDEILFLFSSKTTIFFKASWIPSEHVVHLGTVKSTLHCQKSIQATRMSGETNDVAANKPASPRDSEDLFNVLRTRWSDGVFSDIKVIRTFCIIYHSSDVLRLLYLVENTASIELSFVEVHSLITFCEEIGMRLMTK